MIFARHPTRWLAPYAEGLLPTAQSGAVARHVFRCGRCRRSLDLVRAGGNLAARLAPPPGARAETTAGAPSWSELLPLLEEAPARAPSPFFRFGLAAAAALVLVVGAVAWRGPGAVQAQADSSLAAAALAAHRSTALELRTDDAHLAAAWLRSNAGLDFAPPSSGGERHLLGAARLDGGAVALAYQLGNAPVTLVIAPAAGRADRKQITRFESGGLDVARWTRGDRSYALVSGLPSKAACSICHTGGGPAAVL
jgi:anti-sigma factor RsiW